MNLANPDEIMALFEGRKLPKNVTQLRKPEDLFSVENSGGKKARMYVYGPVSAWSEANAQAIRNAIEGIDADEIELRINSPGGSVFEGVAMYSLLTAHPAKVTTYIDGIAASIASVIALAGDEIHIAESGMVMIHNPSVVAWGGAEVMLRMAEALEKITGSIIATYVSRTNLSEDEAKALMAKETYMTAGEAVKHGFAQSIVKPIRAAALWNPEDFELPEAAKALAAATVPPVDAPPELELKGAVEDVLAARAKVLEISKKYGL